MAAGEPAVAGAAVPEAAAFSTVRKADQICVIENGMVIELGSHDELIKLGGRYRTMFDLQASRFVELDDEGEEIVYDTLS